MARYGVPLYHDRPWVADLHIHSRYSRACSRDLDLPNLAWWARRKGVALLGTGDFTHPAWRDHLREHLRTGRARPVTGCTGSSRRHARRLPPRLRRPPRPGSCSRSRSPPIYKRDDRTRKVHHLVYLPDLDAVGAVQRRARAGSATSASDGRPILGLDSRDLLEITLRGEPGRRTWCPAHIWTPWFSALGSKSGFDAIADCYADLADHIFAVETGLSSDPEMNWRVSSLDRYRLVSNSDAHSPPALGPGGDGASTSDLTTSPSGTRCAPATAWAGTSSSSRRRASTTPTGTAPAASTGCRRRPGRPAAAARSAASR